MTVDQGVRTQVARAELVKRVLIVATVILVSVVLMILLWVVALIRSTQQTGSPTLRAIAAQQDDIERGTDAATATNDQILDCLTPGGTCYEQVRTNSANTITSINEVTAYAAVCADRPGAQSLADIRLCIADLIAAANPSRS